LAESADPAEITDRVVRHVSTWPDKRQWSHGFGLLTTRSDVTTAARRRHAHTVLASEVTLEDLGREFRASPLVLMKGREVAALYPNATMRDYRDLDLLAKDPHEPWHWLVENGYRQDPRRRSDIDHHHLPALLSPTGKFAVELHIRANAPTWTRFDSDSLFDRSAPSRTGIAGIIRPPDDVHALVLALHCWKGGFTRLRDLLDAMLLSAVADVNVNSTAASMGLARMWELSMRVAHHELLGEPDRLAALLAKTLLPRRAGIADRKRTRLLLPYVAANPVRVTRGHIAEYRLGRAARLVGDDVNAAQ
jgi:hypothetical protein